MGVMSHQIADGLVGEKTTVIVEIIMSMLESVGTNPLKHIRQE